MPVRPHSTRRTEQDPVGQFLATIVMEACVFLVGVPVFNTGERRHPSLAGSIPVRLRHVTVPDIRSRPVYRTRMSSSDADRVRAVMPPCMS